MLIYLSFSFTALLKAGADYGSAHELSKAHNIFQYYILYLTQTAALFAGLNTTALVKSICGLCQYLQHFLIA